MKTFFIICVVFIICTFIIFKDHNFYVMIHENKDWCFWRKILKNKETIIYKGHEFKDIPNLENYLFLITIDGKSYEIIWFVRNGIGVFDGTKCVTTDFDRYHATKLRNYLREQFKIGA